MSRGLNNDDFCQILNEALPDAELRIDRQATIPLVIDKRKVGWGYPSAIVCVDEKGAPRELVVPRYGAEHVIPGYLKKYLHACRTTHKGLRLFIACPEDAAADYRKECQFYGLGLISVSLDTMRSVIRERPTNRNIDNAFSTEVRKLKSFITQTIRRRRDDIEKKLDGFRQTARSQGSLADIARHEKPFTDLISELKGKEDHLILRLQEAADSGDRRQLDDVRKEIEHMSV